ncbi:hypothetical protein ACVWY4_005560 [Bacillus mycoides]
MPKKSNQNQYMFAVNKEVVEHFPKNIQNTSGVVLLEKYL